MCLILGIFLSWSVFFSAKIIKYARAEGSKNRAMIRLPAHKMQRLWAEMACRTSRSTGEMSGSVQVFINLRRLRSLRIHSPGQQSSCTSGERLSRTVLHSASKHLTRTEMSEMQEEKERLRCWEGQNRHVLPLTGKKALRIGFCQEGHSQMLF